MGQDQSGILHIGLCTASDPFLSLSLDGSFSWEFSGTLWKRKFVLKALPSDFYKLQHNVKAQVRTLLGSAHCIKQQCNPQIWEKHQEEEDYEMIYAHPELNSFD